jgi:hypothetical protein
MARVALLAVAVIAVVVIVGCGNAEHESDGLPPGFQEPPPGVKKPAGHPSGDCTTCHGPGAAGATVRIRASATYSPGAAGSE